MLMIHTVILFPFEMAVLSAVLKLCALSVACCCREALSKGVVDIGIEALLPNFL